VESGQGLICTHDLEENLLSVNPAAAHLLGYEPAEMVGRNFRKFLAPWSLERVEEYLGYLERDETDSGLLRVLAKDGTERVWVYKSTLFNEPGADPVVLGHAQDITERIRAEEALRRSEAKFRTLVEDAPNAIVITSLTGQIVQINRAVEKMFGHTSGELLGQGIELLIPERFHESHRQLLEKFAVNPVPRPMSTALELYARRKDGNEFPVEIGLGIFETEEGILVGATVLDITERKELESLKDELISIVSHELRTPLTSIRGSLGLLAAGLLGKISGKARHMLEVATNNTDRLVRLINDILDIQRMDAGRMEMVSTVCNAAELMDSVCESLQPVAEEAGVTLRVDSVSVPLWADSDRIIQVLTNLISNAVKFSPEGGTVRLQAENQEGEILFQVSDEGRGIPSHKQGAIFDRFQQVDVSDARVKVGAGLGLAISRKIVEEHGGRIWVESASGQGSTFFFTLPLKVESPISKSL
jgi:PAS domain S-box-containing protein